MHKGPVALDAEAGASELSSRMIEHKIVKTSRLEANSAPSSALVDISKQLWEKTSCTDDVEEGNTPRPTNMGDYRYQIR